MGFARAQPILQATGLIFFRIPTFWDALTRRSLALYAQSGLIYLVYRRDEGVIFGYEMALDRQSNAYLRGFFGSEAVYNSLASNRIKITTMRNNRRD
jgi:hypothetical protein